MNCEGSGISRTISHHAYHEAIPPTGAFDIDSLDRCLINWQKMVHLLRVIVLESTI